MNWRLISILSLFGLAMGVATVYVVPSNIEPLVWLPIFIVCAYVIAGRAPDRPFLHGLAVGVLNSVWITGAHVLLFQDYMSRHPQEAAMTASMPLSNHPRILMAIIGPCIGVVSGAVLGLFSVIATRLRGRGPVTI